MSEDVVASVLKASKAHPAYRTARRMSFAAVLIAAASVPIGLFSPISAAGTFAFAALFAWNAYELFRGIREVALLNRARGATARGDFEEAQLVLNALFASRPTRRSRRHIAAERAANALAQGRPGEAIGFATRAIELEPGILIPDMDRAQIAWAHSLRALAYATTRDNAAALVDVKLAKDDRYAMSATIGNAEIARALAGANEERFEEVNDAIASAAPFLDEVGAREQALAARLAKCARQSKPSAYRHAAKPEEDVHEWLARPAATKAKLAATEVSTTNVPALTVKVGGPLLARRVLFLWVLLILMFLAIWQVLNPSDARPRPPPPPTEPLAWWLTPTLTGAFVVLFVGLMARNLRRASRVRIERRRALNLALRGDAEGVAILERHSKKMRSPEAALELARLADRNAQFEVALRHCDDGLASASLAAIASYDLTTPALFAERAFCFAALGKPDEAHAVLAAMPNQTAYANVASAQLRVRFASALMRGDRAGALEIARSRGDTLPLPSRDAFLIDLLEASDGRGADDEEWTHLHSEIARDPALARWVEHFIGKSKLQRRVAHAEPLEEEESSAAAEGVTSP
jgi:hypothetical protein